MATVRVQSGPFDTGAEIANLLNGNADIGGIGCFLGTVRGTASGKPIVAMTLEHYPGMTERALSDIATQAEARWPLIGCTIIHRTGRLLPGEPIVLVAAASPHRQAALDATAFLIDWLKTKAPFWKQERFASGEVQWVSPKESDDQATAKWHPPYPSAPARGTV
jgi:molybdopterin synthase catalytic subunit